MNIEQTCFGFIGLGLIGGSIAKTIKRLYPQASIVAYNRTYSVLEQAKSDHIADVICEQVDERFSACDYIFLCMPVFYNAQYLELLSGLIKPGCILTDVGSVKTDIHQHVSRLGLEASFIGGHPMAGSDKTGYEHASDRLIENAYYILTPASKVPEKAVREYYALVQTLGAVPMVLDYEEHDYFTACVSHMPHVLASALVHLVKNSDNPAHTMRTIAAGGFKDMTRIASSSAVMWQQICLSNSENICKVLETFIDTLTHAKELISLHDSEKIYQFFDEAAQYRSTLSSSNGLIPSVYELYCDICDETGAIATLAEILSANSINIKNIGIVHNREHEHGVLHIEFYDETARQSAAELLQKHKYSIFVK